MSGSKPEDVSAQTTACDGIEYERTQHPKKVVRAKWHGLLGVYVHAPALIFTGALLGINFAKLPWFDEDGIGWASAANILNALQLAAKLYELAVVASLGAITLQAFKRRLVGGGIPVGLLSGGYRMGDVFYIFSARFWSNISRGGWLAILLIVSTLLSVLVGPASAILIVPELGWYPLPRAFDTVNMPVYLPAEPKTLWPSVLEEGLFKGSEGCRKSRGTYSAGCPGAGFAEIFNWAEGWKLANLSDYIMFSDPLGTTTRRLDMLSNPESGTLLTTPQHIGVSTVGKLRNYIEGQDVGAVSDTHTYKLRQSAANPAQGAHYQPLVNSVCNVWNVLRDRSELAGTDDLKLPSAEITCLGGEDDDDCHRMRDLTSRHRIAKEFWDTDSVTMNWMLRTTDEDEKTPLNATRRTRDDADNEPSSLFFIARAPFMHRGQVGARVVGCSYLARWIPSTLSYNPKESDVVESNVTDLSIFANETSWREAFGSASPGPVISITNSYMPYLSPLHELSWENLNHTNSTNMVEVTQTSTTIDSLFLASLMRYENATGWWPVVGPGSGDDAMDESADRRLAAFMERITGAFLTDAIARSSTEVDPVMVRRGSNVEEDEEKGVVMRLINLSLPKMPEASELLVLENGTVTSMTGEALSPLRSEFVEQLLGQVDEDKGTWVAFDAEQYVYGYGGGEGTMVFAKAVVFAYLALLAVYALVVLCVSDKTVAAWGDLQDMLTLAWSAPAPSELLGKGAGVDNRRFWKGNVMVRATSSKQVVLAMDDEQTNLMKLKQGEEYW